jgi:hypothetical protein
LAEKQPRQDSCGHFEERATTIPNDTAAAAVSVQAKKERREVFVVSSSL